MEAKDTVMGDAEIEAFMVKLCANPKLLLIMVEVIQEISFKAGEKQGIQKGRRGVVEWIMANTTEDKFHFRSFDNTWEWQAKLKEWDISTLGGE